MPLLLSIILPIVLLGVSWGVLTARKLARRGFILWGGLLGVGIMLAVFLIPQHLYNWYSRLHFNKVGLCSVCREWAFVPYLFYWALWGVGGGIGVIIMLISLFRIYRLHPESLLKFPYSRKNFKKVVGFVSLGVGFLLIITYLITEAQNSQLILAINQVSKSIIDGKLVQIGEKRLPIEGNILFFGRSYVDSNGIKFSPDGGWLQIAYGEQVEIWDVRTLRAFYVFEAPYSWSLNTAFSPDARYLVVVNDLGSYPERTRTLSIYQLGRGKPFYQVIQGPEGNWSARPLLSYNVSLATFPESDSFYYDSDIGELAWPSETVAQRPDITSGFQDEMNRKSGEYAYSVVSPDNRLIILGWQKHIEIWRVSPKQKMGELSLPAAVTALAFSPDQRILVIGTADGYIRFFAQTTP